MSACRNRTDRSNIFSRIASIHQRTHMHRRNLAQSLEHIPASDLVASVGRKGHAVGKEQNLAAHPSPRESIGPSRLASHKGSFCHAAT